ncbi:MAG: FAD binding domain-containing protein [Pseudomonadota bacterium]
MAQADDSAGEQARAPIVNGRACVPVAFDPNTSLLAWLREELGLTGTKEGCASGDCGACTVILAAADGSAPYSVNACITPLGHALGKQVVTVEGVGRPGELHPVQAAMVTEHGSQCGFCTPGFIMSMVNAQLQRSTGATVTRAERVRAISGNLCRCTGYRPILDAADVADQNDAGPVTLDAMRAGATVDAPMIAARGYAAPTTEAQLQSLLGAGHRLIAGSTDLWLEVSQRYQDFPGFIDVTAVSSLRAIEADGEGLHIGSAVSHAQLEAYFADGPHACPSLVTMLQRFGSPQVRARGTLGGNLAGGSPIADWSPTLLAADARVSLRNAAGESRTLPLADFFLDYRRTALAADEYLASVTVPGTFDWSSLAVMKISKREDDDISSVLGAFALPVHDGVLRGVRIALGGVAATPVRIAAVETALEGAALTPALIDEACAALESAITPISDVRASADYRRAVAGNLLRKALLRLDGGAPLTLDELLASESAS